MTGFLLASKTQLNEVSIGVNKTSAKVTPFQSIFLSLYPASREWRLANIRDLWDDSLFNPLLSGFLSSYPSQSLANPTVTRNETLSIKARSGWSGGRVSVFGRRRGTRWMKLSVTRARLMHYAEGRIARFGAPLIDRPRIGYLEISAVW